MEILLNFHSLPVEFKLFFFFFAKSETCVCESVINFFFIPSVGVLCLLVNARRCWKRPEQRTKSQSLALAFHQYPTSLWEHRSGCESLQAKANLLFTLIFLYNLLSYCSKCFHTGSQFLVAAFTVCLEIK